MTATHVGMPVLQDGKGRPIVEQQVLSGRATWLFQALRSVTRHVRDIVCVEIANPG